MINFEGELMFHVQVLDFFLRWKKRQEKEAQIGAFLAWYNLFTYIVIAHNALGVLELQIAKCLRYSCNILVLADVDYSFNFPCLTYWETFTVPEEYNYCFVLHSSIQLTWEQRSSIWDSC